MDHALQLPRSHVTNNSHEMLSLHRVVMVALECRLMLSFVELRSESTIDRLVWDIRSCVPKGVIAEAWQFGASTGISHVLEKSRHSTAGGRRAAVVLDFHFARDVAGRNWINLPASMIALL